MPSGKRVGLPDFRPATSRVTQRRGIRPSANTRAHHRAKRRAVASPLPPGYIRRRLCTRDDKEHRWLPVLAGQLPVPIPEPLAKGDPGPGYRCRWSIRRWLDGEPADPDRIRDLSEFAVAVAEFIVALQRIDPLGGPAAGAHSFYRGAALSHYDDEVRRCVEALQGRIDTDRALAVWETALAARWERASVWFHGDVATGNLLVRDGRLAAVIDFGTCGVGDPACNLVISWTLFSGKSRDAFRAAVRQDRATWARARGWALWKALLGLANGDPVGGNASANHRVVGDVLADDLTRV
jgi:aminoglycoside phosphotransferase (APT) family kinase protein